MTNVAKSERQKIIKNSSHYVGSSVIGQGLGLLRAVFMPVIFSPAQLGVWNILNLILSYSSHAQLGLIHGLNKAIPMAIGTDNLAEVTNIRNSVFWVNFLLSIIVLIGVFSYSFFTTLVYAMPLRVLAIVAFIQMIYYYHFALLRATSQFIYVSNGIFLTSVFTTIFVIALAFIFPNPIIGGLTGLGIAILLVSTYWISKGGFSFKFDVNLPTLKRCFIYGSPILAIGVLDSLSVSVDRMFIAANMTEVQLGYYALGIMVSGVLSLIPGSVASVLYPTMIERFSVNRDPKAAKSLLLGPVRMIWALMLVLICFILTAIPIMIYLFIPKYTPAIPVVQLMIFGSFFMSVSHIPGNFLIAIDKQRLVIMLQIVSVLVIFLADTLFIKLGYGLNGIAMGTICGYLVYGIGYTCTALYMVLDNSFQIIKYIFWQIFPFFILLLTFIIIDILLPTPQNYIEHIEWGIVKILILLATLLASLWLVNRDGLVISFLKEEFNKVYRKVFKLHNSDL